MRYQCLCTIEQGLSDSVVQLVSLLLMTSTKSQNMKRKLTHISKFCVLEESFIMTIVCQGENLR